jgi:LPXTG-motif cell wall-anchored protein
VYSTEDRDLKITYKVNDKIMGSVLDNPTNLKFNISFEDAEATDKISKVSIIANGGTIVASKAFDSNKGNWDLQLDPKYDYYYVRIDQADKDIAVTAPVWTGAVTPVGMSKVELSKNLEIVNNPIDITATIYNNGTTPLTDLKVEFFKNSLTSENKIGEQIVANIGAASLATPKLTWTPSAIGTYTLYAKVTMKINGIDKVFTQSSTVEVVNEKDITKVVIDGGHVNQYVTGDYKGKMTALTAMMNNKKFILSQNNDELTASDLQNVKILILTDPQSKDDTKYLLSKSTYTDAEVKVIKDFVSNGGSLIITSRADYSDKGMPVADVAYQNAAQGNKVLSAINSNLRFNDDEVIDKASNGGQEFRLYFEDYTSSKYGLTNNILSGLTYSAYSGCSVLLKEGGNDAKVDWLVKGHATTEILDSDLQKDAIPVAKGAVNSLAAEILPGGGKVIVAGSTFFSDFETLTVDNAYSNSIITNNIIDWMTAEPISIGKIRQDENKDGIPDLLGKRFSIEGRVTSASKGAVNNTAFFDCLYVQDETGGITIFGVSAKDIPLGTKVKVTGVVKEYEGDLELALTNEVTDIQILDSKVELVAPKLLSTKNSMLEENEGWLTKVQGRVTKITENEIYLNDNSGEARIYVNGYIGDETDNAVMLGKWDSKIKVGDTVSAIGLASQDAIGHRLRVRNTAEIVFIHNTPPVILITGVTLNSYSENLNVGGTYQLVATILPGNASNKKLIWASSNEKIAKVDANGKVTAIAVGSATITVTTEDGNKIATCIFTIKAASVAPLPKTGSPIDLTILILMGCIIFAAGTFFVLKRRKEISKN